ncbi:helix-turn-helix domain-containing protein [Nocardia alni]|uniref:helix-turn-helix domain-containing protein n=1 Tax=Nocardia alni TaxID=2815723 RepID=UPI001C23B8C8|nr:helix-turn-helix transcriptional regulator [Nocardia alni]
MVATGCRISPPYLSQLRSGRRTNPSTAVINALALEFEVDPYFLHGMDGGIDDCGLVGRVSDPRLRRLVRTAVGLSDGSQTLLIAVADKLRLAEDLSHSTVDV